MEKEKIISILEYYRNIDTEIKFACRQIKDIEDMYYNPLCAGEKGRGSRRTDNTALDVPEEIKRELEELEQKKNDLCALKLAITKEINRLNTHKKIIIYEKYVLCYKWTQISRHVNYSERQCKNIRTKALDILGVNFAQNDMIKNFDMPA